MGELAGLDVFENLGVRLGQHDVAGAVHARQC